MNAIYSALYNVHCTCITIYAVNKSYILYTIYYIVCEYSVYVHVKYTLCTSISYNAAVYTNSSMNTIVDIRNVVICMYYLYTNLYIYIGKPIWDILMYSFIPIGINDISYSK